MVKDEKKVLVSIRRLILFFFLATLASGITAFPLETELSWLMKYVELFPEFMADWISKVYTGIHETNQNYPFISYGTDWLAFAHIVIALALIGPYRDPLQNKWVIDWAILSCLLVFPLALIAGYVRGIPFFHQCIDCSFGMIGLIPLLYVKKYIRILSTLHTTIKL